MYPHLRPLTPQERSFHIEKTRWDLLRAYIGGEISGARCRALFEDLIRDLMSETDAADLLRRHHEDIEVATFDRETEPADKEIESSLRMVLMNLHLGWLCRGEADDRLERLLRHVPCARQTEWRRLYAKLCKDIGK